MTVVLGVLLLIAIALIPAYIAESRGRSFWVWFGIGLLSTTVALLFFIPLELIES